VNRDSHPRIQADGCCQRRSMEVDEHSLAFACPARSASLNRDEHLQGDTGASSGLMESLR
jgi:hypothetical protein